MRKLILLPFLALTSCVTVPPIAISAQYLIPGGKGVISIQTELPRWVPEPEPDSSLFPTNEK